MSFAVDAQRRESLAIPARMRWLWVGSFAAMLALLGGSSRADPAQIALLRPTAALFLLPALYFLSFSSLKRALLPVVLLAALWIWTGLQLVPLPPAAWQGLPDREALAALDRLTGLGEVWRPIAFVPFRGFNAFFSLLVPIAAVLLALAFKVDRRHLLLLLVLVGLVDAVLGLAQVIGGPRSPLYLFTITAKGAPSGLFANENHSAVFSAIILLIILRLWLESEAAKDPPALRLAGPPAFLLVLLAILVSGSRAGLVSGIAAILACAAMMLVHGAAERTGPGQRARSQRWRPGPRLRLAAFAVSLALLLGTFFWLERTPAFNDLFARDAFEDVRWRLWPILQEMAQRHWLVGIGFGSFEEVYHIYEPTELLLPVYVNQGHNDWIQLLVEGGLPAMAILLALLAWGAAMVRNLARGGARSMTAIIFWAAVFGLAGAASLVDYPLRTPIFQAVFVWLLICLADEAAETQRARGLPFGFAASAKPVGIRPEPSIGPSLDRA